MTEYAAAQATAGVPMRAITRHMLGLFNGLPGARAWRRRLAMAEPDEGPGVPDRRPAARRRRQGSEHERRLNGSLREAAYRPVPMTPIVPPAQASPRPTRNASLLGDERGATAIEYGLIAALMAIVIITGLQALGGETGALYTVIDTITAAIETALSS